MIFFKENTQYKTIKLDEFKYAKDVDQKICSLIKSEYGQEPTKDSLKYIYDTTNNPIKTEYLEGNYKLEYENTTFYYNVDTGKYIKQKNWVPYDPDLNNFVHIGVKKT